MDKKLIQFDDIPTETLFQIIESKQFPPNLEIQFDPSHPIFDLLFKHRNNPELFAKTLLRYKGISPSQQSKPPIEYRHTYTPVIPQEMRIRRLQLKEEELELSRKRTETYKTMLNLTQNLQTDISNLQKQIKHIQKTQEETQKDVKMILHVLQKLLKILRGGEEE